MSSPAGTDTRSARCRGAGRGAARGGAGRRARPTWRWPRPAPRGCRGRGSGGPRAAGGPPARRRSAGRRGRRSRGRPSRESRCRWPTSSACSRLEARLAEMFSSSGTSTTTARQARATSASKRRRVGDVLEHVGDDPEVVRAVGGGQVQAVVELDGIDLRPRAGDLDGRPGDLHAREAPAEVAAGELGEQRAVAAADLERARSDVRPPTGPRASRARARGRPSRPRRARASARRGPRRREPGCSPRRRT